MLGRKCNRVGDGVTPVALSHHRTCSSAYGGSLNTLEASLDIQQRNQPQCIQEAFWIDCVHVACSSVQPRATPAPHPNLAFVTAYSGWPVASIAAITGSAVCAVSTHQVPATHLSPQSAESTMSSHAAPG